MLNNASPAQDLRTERLSAPVALCVLLVVLVSGLMHSAEESAAAYESYAFAAEAHSFHAADDSADGEIPEAGRPPDDHYDEKNRRSLHNVRIQGLKRPFQ
ncbi:hypothetical protein SAMN02982929_00537 [Saccharopolyspora kobensis]|uniref:Uncharacterized protein n=1 Tax=Saccharopolyspora kobensis TaxID=146035 RepID=A0A1H5UHU6_9PSEU|nr:hypothetical protein SAMN02982929_00537 [Saccharopolyspora kobensis]SFC73132.1 hypothetical protein SAMN05216506_1011533 [Saccharopolyspora kobensis]